MFWAVWLPRLRRQDCSNTSIKPGNSYSLNISMSVPIQMQADSTLALAQTSPILGESISIAFCAI